MPEAMVQRYDTLGPALWFTTGSPPLGKILGDRVSKLVLFGRTSREEAATAPEPASSLPPQSYELPKPMLARAFWAFLRGKRRDTWTDASRAISTLQNKPVIHGLQHVPEQGPIVFLPNHYERKDAVWVGWGAMALTEAVARARNVSRLGRMHWVMTDTWADCFIGPFHVDPRYLGWVLKGFGNIYGIIRMPAHDLPNHTTQRNRSARSLLEIFDYLKAGDCVAVHPEAGGFETLIQPPAGAGRVVSCLDRRNVTLIPVGIYEENDHLVVNFGAPIERGTFDGLDDRASADTIMLRIAALVPEETRGVFAERYAEQVEREQQAWRKQHEAKGHLRLEA